MPIDNDHELAYAPVSHLRKLIDDRSISVPELTEMFLRRIETHNPKLNAYLTVTGDLAMCSANEAQQELDQGRHRGVLHGIPISIKDLEITRDVTSTMGSLVFREHVPGEDSVAVERVKEAGAIILGKTNTPEFGMSGTTENRLGDHCRNPWDLERTAGGSSGGAGAALAAGLCAVATGSDGGGSIRIPCSFTGTFGLKPTQGRVPRYGGVGKPSFNTHSQSGPMTRTVLESTQLLQVLAGHDSRDPGCMREEPPDFVGGLNDGVRGLKVAWSPDFGYAPVDEEVLAAVSRAAKAFEELGCIVDEPGLVLDDPFPAFWDMFSVAGATSYGHLLDDHRGELSHYAVKTIEHGLGRTSSDYSRALQRMVQVGSQMEDLFGEYDLLLSPTMAVPAFPVEEHPTVIAGREVDPWWGYIPFTFPINMTGQTAASIPCGFSSDGLPIGLHIVGKRGDEAKVLRACAAFESVRPWADRRPPGF